MLEPLKITCPECKCILVIERRQGKILEVRRPLLEDSSGDRFQDAFEKVKRQKEEVEAKFAKAQKKEKEKKEKLEKIFKESLKRAEEEGPAEKPIRDTDL